MSPHTGELPRAPSRPGLTSHPARCASCASAWGSARAMAVDIIPQHGKTDRRPANPAIPPRLCGRPVTRGSPRPPGPLLPRAPHPRSGEPRAPVHPSSVPASTASTLRGLGTPPDSPPDSSFLDCDQTPLGTPCFRSSRCPHAGVPPRGRAPSLSARELRGPSWAAAPMGLAGFLSPSLRACALGQRGLKVSWCWDESRALLRFPHSPPGGLGLSQAGWCPGRLLGRMTPSRTCGLASLQSRVPVGPACIPALPPGNR